MPPQINIVVSATNQTQQGFAGVQAGLASVTVATQQATQATQTQTSAQNQQAQSARGAVTLQQQLARTNKQIALSSTDTAGRIRIWREEVERLTIAERQAGLQGESLARAQNATASARLNLVRAENAGTRPGLSGTIRQLGAGALLQAGVATGAAVLGQQLIQLGNQSIDLATRAETIGTAYEGATRRAGVGADRLLQTLKNASRGTVSETNLMASANKALALGVGQDTDQIGALLAIARQKGKDFGESTQQAFEDITIGLGRLSPRILDNLGIILDENKIYIEYAKSIGVATGKLSDQEKRQALVNDLIKNNSGLISQNAQARLDAADKSAQAIARQETAEARLGQALVPIKTAYQETFATILEGLTGITRETDRAAQQKILATSSGLEDYRAQARQRTQELYASGNVIGARQNAMDMPRRSGYDAAQAQARAQIAATQTARDDRYIAPSVAPTAAPTIAPPRFSGFGTPISGGTTNIINITNTGAVVTPQNIVDDVDRALQEKARRNGYATVHHQ